MELKLEVTAALLIAPPSKLLVKCTTYSLNGALVLCAHTLIASRTPLTTFTIFYYSLPEEPQND